MTAAGLPAARPGRRFRLPGGSATPGIVLVFLLWELAARSLSGAYLLAAPTEVVIWLSDNLALTGRALGVTLANATAGFLLGNLAAVLLAAVAFVWPRSERVIASLALLVFCLPLVAIGPILRVSFGPGPWPQITLAALAVYYTTLIPLLVGLRAAPASWFDLVRSYGRGRFSALVHVRAMASLPYFFAGLQIAAPAAFLGAMIGEFTGAERGMGVLTIRAMRALDVEMTWALASVASGVAILAYVAIGRLARRVLLADPPVILAPPDIADPAARRFPALRHALVVTAAALLLWWGTIVLLDLNPFFAKGPAEVLDALAFAPDAAATRATLATALGETAIYLLPGYLAGLALGAGLAMLLVLVPALASTAMPIAIALRSVPIVTTAPLVVLVLGRGAVGTVSLVALMVFFPDLRRLPARAAAGPWTDHGRVRHLCRRPDRAPPARAHPGDAAGLLRRRPHERSGLDPGGHRRRMARHRQRHRQPDGALRLALGLRHALERRRARRDPLGPRLRRRRCRRAPHPLPLRRRTADPMTPAPRPAAFAIPGDIETLTGGYIYERRLLEGLRDAGRDVAHIRLAAGFPDPSPDEMAEAVACLAALDPARVLILDGLVFGAIDTAGLARVRAPIVAMIHHPLALESGLDEDRSSHLFRTERDNLALAAHVLVPSPHTRKVLCDSYGVAPDRITIARPGVDRPAGNPDPVTPPLILSVGIQHPRKGHDILLDALAGLTDLDWQAVIAGSVHDPACAEALARQHASLGLGPRVRLAGRVPQADLEALYRAASIFALATRYEGYGIVFDEALVHGLPIVSCRTGAVPDTVPEAAGLLVPPEDPAALRRALRHLLTDEAARTRMAAAARTAGAALPGWPETARTAGTVLDALR